MAEVKELAQKQSSKLISFSNLKLKRLISPQHYNIFGVLMLPLAI